VSCKQHVSKRVVSAFLVGSACMQHDTCHRALVERHRLVGGAGRGVARGRLEGAARAGGGLVGLVRL
jgi:hypothetical protein